MFGVLPLCLAICICVSVYGDTEMEIVCNIISEVNVTITKDWTPRVVLKVVSEEEVFEKYKPFGIVISLDNDPIYTRDFKPKKKPFYITLESNTTLKKRPRSFLYVDLKCLGNCANCMPLYEKNISNLLVSVPEVTPKPAEPTSSNHTYIVKPRGDHKYMFVLVAVGIICLVVVVAYIVIKRRRNLNSQSRIISSYYPFVESPSLPNDSLVIFMDVNLEDDVSRQITDHLKRHFELLFPRDHEMKISENRHDWIDQNILSKHCRNFLTIIKDVAAADDRVLSPAERAVMKDVHNLNQNNILTLRILPDCATILPDNTVMSCHRSMVDEEMTRVVSFFRDP